MRKYAIPGTILATGKNAIPSSMQQKRLNAGSFLYVSTSPRFLYVSTCLAQVEEAALDFWDETYHRTNGFYHCVLKIDANVRLRAVFWFMAVNSSV